MNDILYCIIEKFHGRSARARFHGGPASVLVIAWEIGSRSGRYADGPNLAKVFIRE